MSNEQLFNWFAFIIGIAFLVWLSLPIIQLMFFVSESIGSFLPKRRLSDDEIDRMFNNNFVVVPEKNQTRNRNKKPTNPYQNNLNTSSSIREYSLPDGSKVAFDADEVDVSERSAI